MRYRLRTLLTQFSIRDLLWLIVVSALAFAWLREHSLTERMKVTLAKERESDAKKLNEKFVRFAQLQLEATRMIEQSENRVQLYRDRYDTLRDKVDNPAYPYDAGRGTYFLAPVR